jgi:A/G-specific adenine glycosylase
LSRAQTAGTAGPSDPVARWAARLLAWHKLAGRQGLPWQGTRDPYRVWLSEVMLQQTQVATVLGYYARFLDRFPSVADLAAAPLDEVLALWSGLGYYSRARHLHRCAQAVVATHGGAFPRDAATLATLPGIGRSTAAAIAAFCFDERVAILDGNVKRVLARHLAFGDDLARPAAERALWQHAAERLPMHAADMPRYTQALMDLGATLCTPREPRCGDCPVATDCRALAEGRPQAYPVKTRTLRRQRLATPLLWLERGDAVLLVRRPATGVWAGLWSFPELADDLASAATQVRGWPGQGAWQPPLLHVLTHRDWTLTPLRWRLPERGAAAALRQIEQAWPAGRWWPRSNALAAGLPAPVRRWLMAAVDEAGGR